MTQSRTTKIERDASPKYTESKRTAVKNSVTRRNSRKRERDEGEGGKSESKRGRVTRDGIYERPLMSVHTCSATAPRKEGKSSRPHSYRDYVYLAVVHEQINIEQILTNGAIMLSVDTRANVEQADRGLHDAEVRWLVERCDELLQHGAFKESERLLVNGSASTYTVERHHTAIL